MWVETIRYEEELNDQKKVMNSSVHFYTVLNVFIMNLKSL